MAPLSSDAGRKERLTTQRRALPDGPGVYLFRDRGGTVIYVGKAKSIRKRVANHFNNSVTRGAVEMVDVIDDIEFVLVSSETEALLVENGFIKQYQPQFNIRLRDDKSYPYICVTLREDYPRVYPTREKHRPGNRYFGPYSNAKRVRNTLELLGRLFQYRTCRGAEPGRRSGSPCLDYHIERCTAPCVDYVSKAEYRDQIDGVMAFLAGRYREIESGIETRMKEAAADQDYERAARERDRLQSVRSLLERQRVTSDSIGSLDAIAVTVEGDDANAQVFQVRDGSLVDRQSFYLTGVAGEALAARAEAAAVGTTAATIAPGATVPGTTAHLEAAGATGAVAAPDAPEPDDATSGADARAGSASADPPEDPTAVDPGDDEDVVPFDPAEPGGFGARLAADDAVVAEVLEQFLLRYYAGAVVPPVVLVPDAVRDHAPLAAALADVRGKRVEVTTPQRGDRRRILDMATRNAELALGQERLRAERSREQRSGALSDLQASLGLERLPMRVECYDISHTMGTETVASMVVLEGGMPSKAHYRRFIIRDLEEGTPDDFKSMNEVLRRRMAQWTRQQEKGMNEPNRDASFAALPDLIVIDGGKGQLSSGIGALETFVERGVAVVSLAKRIEEVFVPGKGVPIVLGHDTPGLQMLQRARDEAHRFAITHHRGRRDKKLTTSVLDDLPGVGPARRKALIQHFGSPDAVVAASRDELEATPGLPGKLAREIYVQLHRGGS
ncbi:excinuclease ABC subunit UvrC [Patulibacter sp.]|uniref:excinuclease ABC subunit UvrC n=1 Tax=Patulibacter sp. TaxID=1912859 RepID=UPI00271C5F84|nr:excinuclease ABC subunit UvrC [Patulibacter sp.]MDO9409524.1 excinuclease ABC subunit UvrC [Patulibacter sp.]